MAMAMKMKATKMVMAIDSLTPLTHLSLHTPASMLKSNISFLNIKPHASHFLTFHLSPSSQFTAYYAPTFHHQNAPLASSFAPSRCPRLPVPSRVSSDSAFFPSAFNHTTCDSAVMKSDKDNHSGNFDDEILTCERHSLLEGHATNDDSYVMSNASNDDLNANDKDFVGERTPVTPNCSKSLAIDKAFEELGLKPIQDQVGGIRVRQHANPLKASLQVKVAPPNWDEVFLNPNLPLFVDIGCGSGRFLLVLAKRHLGQQNFLGLEIRKKLVERSILWAKELQLQNNTHFIEANATVNLDNILQTYPGDVKFISILCPDPQFKNRHKKRRVLQPELVKVFSKHIVPGGNVFFQSDVESVAIEMKDIMTQYNDGHFELSSLHNDVSSCNDNGWLLDNPLNVASEREVCVLSQGLPMYRVLFTKK